MREGMHYKSKRCFIVTSCGDTIDTSMNMHLHCETAISFENQIFRMTHQLMQASKGSLKCKHFLMAEQTEK